VVPASGVLPVFGLVESLGLVVDGLPGVAPPVDEPPSVCAYTMLPRTAAPTSAPIAVKRRFFIR